MVFLKVIIYKEIGEERSLLNLYEALHCREGAIPKYSHNLHGLIQFSPCYLFNAEETIHMLAQVWPGCPVTCQVVTQWCFLQKYNMLRILGVTNVK